MFGLIFLSIDLFLSDAPIFRNLLLFFLIHRLT